MVDDLTTFFLPLCGVGVALLCVRVYCVVLEEHSPGSWWSCPAVCGVWLSGCVGWWVSSCYGGHSVRETPGSIPNPVAKPDSADGTALGRVWESRTPPDILCGGVARVLGRVAGPPGVGLTAGGRGHEPHSYPVPEAAPAGQLTASRVAGPARAGPALATASPAPARRCCRARSQRQLARDLPECAACSGR
jgi:hypothetical protein